MRCPYTSPFCQHNYSQLKELSALPSPGIHYPANYTGWFPNALQPQSNHMDPPLSPKHKRVKVQTVGIEATLCFVCITMAMQGMAKLPRAMSGICKDFVNWSEILMSIQFESGSLVQGKLWQSKNSSSQCDANRKKRNKICFQWSI